MPSRPARFRLPAVFQVWLTGKPGSRDEKVQLEVSEAGVKLLQLDGTDIDFFPFSVISKWLPAELRTQNPGAADCFDIQIQTTSGPKDLRMRASSAEQVQDIVSLLVDTANAVAESSAEGDWGAPLSGMRATAPARLSELRTPTTAALSPSSSPMLDTSGRQGTAPHEFHPANTMPLPGGMPGRSLPRSPVGPTRQTGALRPDADIGTPPSRRRVDIGLLAFPRADGGETAGLGSEARRNMRFLEDVVRRLSEELSRAQATEAPSADAQQRPTPPAFLEGVVGNAPLPLWLSDPKYLSPLLVAYDKHIQEQEQTMKEASEKIQRLESSISEVTNENERLMADVARQLDLLSKHASDQQESLGDTNRDTVERMELLVQENDLLTHQQAELEAEITRLMGRMEERTREHVNVAQENSRLQAKLRSTQVRLTEAEARAARFKMMAKTEEQRAALLEEHSGGAPRAFEAPSDRNAGMGEAAAPSGPSLQQQLRQREDELAAAASEVSSLRQQLMEVLGSNNALQARIASLEEQSSAAQAATSAANSEAEELRGALASMDVRLTDFHRKDAEVYSRIKEAMEQAEQAKLAREALEGRETMLRHENESLRRKLGQLVHQLEERFESDAEIRESGLRSDLDARNSELEELKMQVAQLEASLARRGRDVESLQREKAGIVAQLENVPMSERNLGGSAATLANMERLKEMQEKLDKAEEAAEGAKRELQHCTRAAALERQKLQAEVVGLIRKQSELESRIAKAQSELSKAQLEAERAKRSELDTRQQRIKAENELRAALDAVSRDRDVDVRRLTGRIDDVNAMLAQGNQEHSKALAAYEAQIAQWREEALHLRDKLSGIRAEHQEEMEQVRKQSEHAASAAASNSMQQASPAVADEMRQQVAAMLKAEEELLAERMELRLALDRAQLQQTRATRAKENAESKCKLLQRQCESLQELLFQAGDKTGYDNGAGQRPDGGKTHRPRVRAASTRFRRR